MLTRTKLAIAVAVLATSASSALAQYASPGPTYGVPAERVQRVGPAHGVQRHTPAPRRQLGYQRYENEVPFAPF